MDHDVDSVGFVVQTEKQYLEDMTYYMYGKSHLQGLCKNLQELNEDKNDIYNNDNKF